MAPYLSSAQIAYFYEAQCAHVCCGSALLLSYSSTQGVDQVIVDFDLDRGSFQFLDRQETVRALGIVPKNDAATQDYLADLFILAGGLYGIKISTTAGFTIEQLIQNLN